MTILRNMLAFYAVLLDEVLYEARKVAADRRARK